MMKLCFQDDQKERWVWRNDVRALRVGVRLVLFH
jgi:hypothetical protein